MVFRIKFICEEVDGFVREIKIDSDATFLDLNKVILKSCNYPDDQLTSFYLCNDEWERGEQITREDMGFGSSDEDIYVMENTRLSEQIEMSNDDPLAPVKGGKKKAVAADDDFSDDNIFGDGAAFNDDEIDYEGFEITDGNPYE